MNCENFPGLLLLLDSVKKERKDDLYLFRGQNVNKPLLPKIARRAPSVDTTDLEREMLNELTRRGQHFDLGEDADRWDLLVQAQHYGMATRLLDWTSNPLVALWFACSTAMKDKPTYFYSFKVDRSLILDRKKSPDPFTRPNTRILKAKLNNDRIIAQSGWFTAHKYAESERKFVAVDANPRLNRTLRCVKIEPQDQEMLMIQLDSYGTNYQSMFPDVEGLCRQVNWLHDV